MCVHLPVQRTQLGAARTNRHQRAWPYAYLVIAFATACAVPVDDEPFEIGEESEALRVSSGEAQQGLDERPADASDETIQNNRPSSESGKKKKDLKKDGYKCEVVSVGFEECTKKDQPTYWCSGNECQPAPKRTITEPSVTAAADLEPVLNQ